VQEGKLPLHLELQKGARRDVIALLVVAAVAAKDSSHFFPAIKEFAEHEEKVLAALLDDLSAQEGLLQECVLAQIGHGDVDEGGSEKAHTFYSWTTLVSETEDTPECIGIVQAIIHARKKDVKGVRTLPYLLDASGRRAIDM